MFHKLTLAFFAVFISAVAAVAQAPREPWPDVGQGDPNVPAPEFALEGYPRAVFTAIGRLRSSAKRNGLALRGHYASLFLWPPTIQGINVCFLDGTTNQRRRVVDVAKTWTQFGARIPLNFGSETNPRTCIKGAKDQHIRITVAATGLMWSAVGRQSMFDAHFPGDKPSMSLGFKPRTHPDEVDRAILHEFGHALGLEHEHQSPKLDCWAKHYHQEKLKAYLLREAGWKDDDVRQQLELLQYEGLIATDADAASIMLYGFPATYYRSTDNPCFPRKQTTPELSVLDKALMRRLYPALTEERTAVLQGRQEHRDKIRSSQEFLKTRSSPEDAALVDYLMSPD